VTSLVIPGRATEGSEGKGIQMWKQNAYIRKAEPGGGSWIPFPRMALRAILAGDDRRGRQGGYDPAASCAFSVEISVAPT
jgi:hypothetical protein